MTSAANDELAGGLPRNYLRPCLLLLLVERPAHGYDLLDQIGELGLQRIDPGGVYRSLRSMEQEGLVSSWWETSQAGPARRTYEPTEQGVVWLHSWVESLREVHRFLGLYLQRYAALAEGVRPGTPYLDPH